jgi:membrane protein DedA with SNARE-associated domain
VITVAAAAAIVGDNIGYLIGRSLGFPLLARYGHHVCLTKARLEVGRYLFLTKLTQSCLTTTERVEVIRYGNGDAEAAAGQ